MSQTTRKKYSDEFKQEAVRLAVETDKPKSQIARELGIGESLLYSWIDKYDEAKSVGMTPEQLKAEREEVRQLKSELKRLKTENEILKKAAAYFAKDHT
jgi:transposase